MKFALLILLFCINAQSQEITNEATTNPAYRLIFEEELRFGGDPENDRYFWTNASTLIESDSKGQIYISDTDEDRILIYDPSGKFLKILASKGPGPGELKELVNLQILSDGRKIALDLEGQTPRFQYFDENNQYIKRVSPPSQAVIPLAASFSPTNPLIGAYYINFDMDKQKVVHHWGMLNDQFQLKKVITKGAIPIPTMERIGNPGGFKSFLAEYIKLTATVRGYIRFDSEGYIYIADSQNYKVEKWDPSFSKKIFTMRKKYKAISYTDADHQQIAENVFNNFVEELPSNLKQMVSTPLVMDAIEKSQIGPAKMPIMAVITMEKGQFLVVHDNQPGGIQTADVFDKDGKHLGTATMPHHFFLNPANEVRLVFRNGKAYTILSEDEIVAARFNYRLAITKE